MTPEAREHSTTLRLTPTVWVEAASCPLSGGGWMPVARLHRGGGEEPLYGPREKVFPTRAEADRYALGLGAIRAVRAS